MAFSPRYPCSFHKHRAAEGLISGKPYATNLIPIEFQNDSKKLVFRFNWYNIKSKKILF